MATKSKKITLEEENPEYTQNFYKLFKFYKNKNWTLPKEAYQNQKFVLPEFQKMKHELNEVKGLLSQFDLSEWSKHTQFRDTSSYIMDYLKKRIKPELMTQAWCKFYEITGKLSCFIQMPQTARRQFSSLHLCEAPGAFICALNHYLALNYDDLEWTWLANTLNPSYEGNQLSEMIPDDRLIRHTQKNWYFGVDFTGDMQRYYNHVNLVDKINSKEKVWLVTADGSIDCMKDPGEQERHVEYLHYCEAMTALAVLQKGGTFVLKIFTIFEDSTVCLMYLLNCVFEQVTVFKPCSSKSGNSEVYVIGNGYLGSETSANIWEQLLIPYKLGHFDTQRSMFSVGDLPRCFVARLYDCCDFYARKQIKTITDNVYFFEHRDEQDESYFNNVYYTKMCAANYYIKKYKLRAIPKHRRVVPHLNVYERGPKLEILNFNRCNVSDALDDRDISRDILDITIGKRINYVRTSKFMSQDNLENISKHSRRKNDDEIPSSLYSTSLKRLSPNNIVINVKDFDLTVYHVFQRELFLAVSASINEKCNMIFINVPFHTHFLAGLWLIVAYAFREVYFECGRTIFLNPMPSSVKIVKELLEIIHGSYERCENVNFRSDIVQIVPPECFHVGSTVASILYTNNQIWSGCKT